MSITLVCDGCNEEDSIVGNDHALVYSGIGGWDLDRDGNLVPEWSGNNKSGDPEPRFPDMPYCCNACNKRFSENWLHTLIKPPEGDDDED